MRVKLPGLPVIQHTVTRGDDSITFELKPLPPGQAALMEMRLPTGKWVTSGRHGRSWQEHTPGEASVRGNRFVYAIWGLMLRDADMLETPIPKQDGPGAWEKYADALAREADEAGLMDSDVVAMVNRVSKINEGSHGGADLGN